MAPARMQFDMTFKPAGARRRDGDAPAAGTTPAAGAIPIIDSTPAPPAEPSKPQLPPAAPVNLTFQPEGVVTRAGSITVWGRARTWRPVAGSVVMARGL